MLLAAAWQRVLIAGVAVAALWLAVWWATPGTQSLSPVEPSRRIAPGPPSRPSTQDGALHAVVRSGEAAPGGGRFDRFEVPGQPIVAPVNATGQVAFYATVPRSAGREGIFLAGHGRVTKVAMVGDDVPGGGTIAGFTAHPQPALNAAGHVAFGATIAGGRSTEVVFLSGDNGLQAIARAGDEAPGVPTGVLTGFDAPALNDNDELALLASVRRGQDTIDVLYFWNGQRLGRVVAERDPLLRIGGTMDKIGVPALNNSGVIAFPAAIFKGPTPGGIFVAGSRELRLFAAIGDPSPGGAMIVRFSDHLAIDEQDGIVFGAYLGGNGAAREAVLRTGPDGLNELAVEGAAAPGGGRYAGFGPWATVAPEGVVAFVAALDGGPGPLAAFAGLPGDIRRVVTMGETLPDGLRMGRFALHAVAMAGPGKALTIATMASEAGEPSAIYRLGPVPESR